MNSTISRVAAFGLILPLFALGLNATAQGTTTNEKSEMATVNDRVSERKLKLKTTLNSNESSRLKSRCKSAQGVVSEVSGRARGVEISRSATYRSMLSRLQKLNQRLTDQGLDSAELQKNIDELSVKIETFKTDMTAYRQAIDDLAVMDCVADPTGFKATLETARTARTAVLNDSAAIKEYMNNTVKATIKSIRTQLALGGVNNSAQESSQTKVQE